MLAYVCVTSELYFGLCDLLITVCTIIFTDLQKKLAAARWEEKKQSRVTGKFDLMFFQTGGPFCYQKCLIGRASGLRG